MTHIARAALPAIEPLLEAAFLASRPEDLVALFAEHAEPLGVVSVDYGFVESGQRQPGWSTNPACLRTRYFDGRLHEIDPEYHAEGRPDRRTTVQFPGGYPEWVAVKPDMGGLFEELRAAGRTGMVFVPDLSPEGRAEMATFNLMTDTGERLVESWGACEGEALGIAATVLHLRMRDLRHRARQGACPLSRREREVLQAFADGARAAQIAGRLDLSERTVEHHARAARTRLGAATRDQAVAIAAAAGWVRPGSG